MGIVYPMWRSLDRQTLMEPLVTDPGVTDLAKKEAKMF